MYCPKCGKEVKDDAKFCSNCGETLVNPEEFNETGGETGAPAGTQYGPRYGYLSTTTGRMVLFAIIAAAAVAAAAGGMAGYRHSQAKAELEQVAGGEAASVPEEEQTAGEEGASVFEAEPEETEITDDMYPGLLEGGLTKEQFEIALAYAPAEMENGEISTEDLLIMVDEITYDFPEECFDGTYTQEWTDYGSGYYTFDLSKVNNFLSVLTDKQLSQSDMRQWDYPDELSISGDTVTVTLYDGEWMTPLAEITNAVKGDGEITVTYNVRARGPGDYYPESTATRTAILKLIPDGGYRVDRIFTGTVDNPYRIDRQVLKMYDEYGYDEEWSYYDLVSLEEKDKAHAAINAALGEDYQAYIDYNERMAGKTVDEIRDSIIAEDFNAATAGLTNIENGILSIKFSDMIMEGDVMGTWYYGLTYSLTTGEELNITDLTDLDDRELLSRIKSALMDFVTGNDYLNQSEMISQVNAFTLDDFGSGYDFWDTYSLSFCVDDGEIIVLVPPGTFFDSIWSNQAISTGIYIPGAEPRADEYSSADTASSSDTNVTGSVREIYEQVLKDVQNGRYYFDYAVAEIKGYKYFLTDMDGDGTDELIVAKVYNTNSGTGVGVFDFYDSLVFSAEVRDGAYTLREIDGEVDMLGTFYASDGNGFYAEVDFGRGTGIGYFNRVTIQSGALSFGSTETYSMADDSMDRFIAANPSVDWYDASDLSGLSGLN